MLHQAEAGTPCGKGETMGAVTQHQTAATANCTMESSTGLRPSTARAVRMMCSA